MRRSRSAMRLTSRLGMQAIALCVEFSGKTRQSVLDIALDALRLPNQMPTQQQDRNKNRRADDGTESKAHRRRETDQIRAQADNDDGHADARHRRPPELRQN